MAARAVKTNPLSPHVEQALLALDGARERTLTLVAGLSEDELERTHSPIMSPLVWDLGHIAAYEDLWLARRLGGLELLRPDLAGLYDAFETPRAICGEMEARHELQHLETMRQTMAIAGLLPAGEPTLHPPQAEAGWIEIPAGPFSMGAGPEGFAYDNERPRHTVEVGAFAIARLPVSNESWLRFSDSGGYERRECWSQEGWAWKHCLLYTSPSPRDRTRSR